jgi:hypothetical protein
MRKILLSLLAISATSAFALGNNADFQAFDNEANIGLGFSSTDIKGAGGFVNGYSAVNQQAGLINLEAEHLFNNGIWVDVNANTSFDQSNGNGALGANNATNYGINGKVGYAFTFNSHLQLTPYGLVGVNNDGLGGTNALLSLPDVNNTSPYATTNQMFLTGGVGARLEFRINNAILLYADQDAVYNSDQGTYGSFGGAQNNYQETSMIGAKFNIVDNFQLGVKGFYNNYQYQTSGVANNALQAEDGYGALVTFGLTY